MDWTTFINSWPHVDAQANDEDKRSSTSEANFLLRLSELPKGTTTFFDNWPHSCKLPTPAQIRTFTYDFPFTALSGTRPTQQILHVPELGLIVKHGQRTTITEGQMLWAIKKLCPEMRVPAVYGWCMDEGEMFIYLSYIDGVTLHSRLDDLTEEELDHIAQQLSVMLRSLRRVEQPVDEQFIGSPHKGPIGDQLWWDEVLKLPFSSVPDFNDALFNMAKGAPQFPQHEVFQRIRPTFPDTATIRLTHTDLSPFNVIVSRTGTEVMGIIDWQESGWYPDYWEYVKTRYMAPDKWVKHVDTMLEPWVEPFESVLTYVHMGICY